MEDAGVIHNPGFDGIQDQNAALHAGEARQLHTLFGGLGEEIFAGHVAEEVVDDDGQVVPVSLEGLCARHCIQLVTLCEIGGAAKRKPAN